VILHGACRGVSPGVSRARSESHECGNGLKRRIVVANRVDDGRHALDVVQVALIGDAVQVDECRDVLTPTYSARHQGAGGEGPAIGLKATAPV